MKKPNMTLKTDKEGFVKIPMSYKQERQIQLLEKKDLLTAKYKIIKKHNTMNDLFCTDKFGDKVIGGTKHQYFMKITPKEFKVFKQDLINAGYRTK